MIELKRIRANSLRLDRLNERIVRLRAITEMGAKQLSLAPARTEVRNRLEDNIAKLDELERELVQETIKLEESMQACEWALEQLQPLEQRIVLRRDFEGLPWRQVARREHYSVDYCKEIHGRALRKIAKM